MSELLPCPFCGGRADIIKTSVIQWVLRGNGYAVHCTNCQVRFGGSMHEDAAISDWNRRADRAQKEGM